MCNPVTGWQFLSVSAVITSGSFYSRDRNSPSKLIRGGLSCLNKLPEATKGIQRQKPSENRF